MKKIYEAPQTEVVALQMAGMIAGSGSASFEVGEGENQGGISGPITKDDGSDESDAKGNGNFDLWED